jgi:hypothetical protein
MPRGGADTYEHHEENSDPDFAVQREQLTTRSSQMDEAVRGGR